MIHGDHHFVQVFLLASDPGGQLAIRQLLDIVSPANFPLTNPEVLRATLEQSGANVQRGWLNFVEDWERSIAINVTSMYDMMRAFLPSMLAAQAGSIINMSSVASSEQRRLKKCFQTKPS